MSLFNKCTLKTSHYLFGFPRANDTNDTNLRSQPYLACVASVSAQISMFWLCENWGFLFLLSLSPSPLFLFLLSPQLSRCQNIEICAETPLKRLLHRLAIPAGDHWIPSPVPLDLALSSPNGGAELSCLVSLHKYSCSSVISTLEGIGLTKTMR